MFVLYYHKALKDYENFCATQNERNNLGYNIIKGDMTVEKINQLEQKARIFQACRLVDVGVV